MFRKGDLVIYCDENLESKTFEVLESHEVNGSIIYDVVSCDSCTEINTFKEDELIDFEKEFTSAFGSPYDEYEKDFTSANPWDAPGMSVSDFL